MAYSILEQTLTAQPVLIVRRTVGRSQIAATIGEALGLIHAFAQQHGVPLGGNPFTRYVDMRSDSFTMEPGMRIMAPAPGLQGAGEVLIDSLPAGPAAVTLHLGPYDKLGEAYTALQEWMKEQGARPAGGPWEEYITDPEQTPDPAAWQTRIYWPIAR